MLLLVLADTLNSYTTTTPHGAYRYLENGKVTTGIADMPFVYQLRMVWVHITIVYVGVEMANVVYGILAVLLGFAAPRECPSLFGDLKKMYTLRNCWS